MYSLGRRELSLALHSYLNYHRFKVDNFPLYRCRFCGEGREESIHLTCECLGVLRVLELGCRPPDLSGLVRLTQVGCINMGMEWRADMVRHTGGSPRQAAQLPSA